MEPADRRERWMPIGGGACGDIVRALDWSATPLGPIAQWPVSLRSLVQTLLRSRHPMFLWWGPELIQFYNDAYRPSFGEGRHPSAMGQRAADCWGEIWPLIGPQIDAVMRTGVPTWHEDALVPILRNGRMEEVFWTYGYSAAYDDDAAIAGTLVVCTETTAGVLANRRLRLTAKLAERAGLCRAPDEILGSAFDCLSEVHADVPFAVAFDERGAMSHQRGLPTTELAESLAAATSGVEEEEVRVLPTPIAAGPWPEPVTAVYVLSLAESGQRVVFGISPRLPFDDAYRDFLRQIVGTIRTARHRVAAIAQQVSIEAERRDLLMQAPVASALLIGPELRYELANPMYVEMVGREVLGKRYVDAFPEVVGTPVLDAVLGVYRTGEPLAVDEMLVPLRSAQTGRLEDHYFKFTLQPMRGSAGEVNGIMVVALDITESVAAREAQARAHEELQCAHDERAQLVEQLEAANRAKDEFMAMLGHELRNPLAPIVTALELIARRTTGEPSREHALITRQVAHLVRLVDDLLDVARITRGKIELRRESCEIGQVIDRAIEMVEALLDERRQHLVVEVPEPIAWWGDPTRLAQVVANLLTNAARYSPAGSDIRVEAGQSDGEVRITVSDDGNGIAPEMLDSIFGMFTQGFRPADRAEGGLGLGLTLARSLVEMHEGTIEATSEGLGHGSTFTVRLPVTVPDAVAVPAAVTTSATPTKVLVVDDNEDAAEMIAALLESHGHEVRVAHDGPSALDAFAAFGAEVAVLDIGLPVMDGYELAGRLSQASGGRVRLVALTGYGQAGDRARSSAAGFDAHLVKPVDFEQLAAVIERLGAPRPG